MGTKRGYMGATIDGGIADHDTPATRREYWICADEHGYTVGYGDQEIARHLSHEHARLIAAAPELLEAAQAVAAFLSGPKDRFGRVDAAGNDAVREARERVRLLSVKYGLPGQATYVDQCAAVLRAAIKAAS